MCRHYIRSSVSVVDELSVHTHRLPRYVARIQIFRNKLQPPGTDISPLNNLRPNDEQDNCLGVLSTRYLADDALHLGTYHDTSRPRHLRVQLPKRLSRECLSPLALSHLYMR